MAPEDSPDQTCVRIGLDADRSVSGLLTRAAPPFALLVLAHGAGAGMGHRFMQAVAEALSRRGVSVLRYQFPYMEAGSKRPDRPAAAHSAVRAAVAVATALADGLPVFAGGKSFGARMTSQAQALDALPGVRGLVSFGFPLHPAGTPSTARAAHLSDVRVPMLFLQGTRDALAALELMSSTVAALGQLATLRIVPDADHAFHVPIRSGRTDAEVLEWMTDQASAWMRAVTLSSST